MTSFEFAFGTIASVNAFVAILLTVSSMVSSRRHERFEFMRNRISDVQAMNLTLVSNDEALSSYFALFPQNTMSQEERRSFILLMMALNRVQTTFLCADMGIISAAQRDAIADNVANLYRTQAQTSIELALSSYGYRIEFAEYFRSRIKLL